MQGLFSHPYTYEPHETGTVVVGADHRLSREGLFRDPFDETTAHVIAQPRRGR
ncbi:hypothetical protein [Actinosynnema sp. ALI-1.44]|uniref:hypothetical protein n=1 Tax=Actinosynnema sp. ALI-1.44 TaxID=1933779 RepID=UPI00143DE427|nr:hypothetical protein [Actinosynnema sp. ALI-1.44]